MALFIPCPVVPPPGPGPSLVFLSQPGFGPHLITTNLANNVLIRDEAGFAGTALTIPTNAAQPMDIGVTIRVYNMALGLLFMGGFGVVTYTGPGSIGAGIALVITKTATDDWIGAIQPFPVF